MAHIQVVKVEKHLEVVYMTNDNNLCGPVLHAPCEEVSRKQILDIAGDYRWYSEYRPSLHVHVL